MDPYRQDNSADGRSPDDTLADDLEGVARRDLDALSRVFRKTYGRLLSLAMRIIRDRETAEDVLQEVYIKIWNRAGGFDRERATPIVWLSVLTRNSAIDALRARALRPSASSAEIPDVADGARLIDETLIEQEQHGQAVAMLDHLSGSQQDNIRDIYFEGLTYAELAQRDGVPMGTIKSRVHRALTVLNERWSRD